MVIEGYPRIEIYGKPGLYLLDSDFSTGKTYLYSELKRAEHYDNSIFTYTYDDYFRKLSISISSAVRLVMADRADWYRYDMSVMRECYMASKHAVVLMDIKNTDRLPYPFKFASVDFDVENIDVYCDNFI